MKNGYISKKTHQYLKLSEKKLATLLWVIGINCAIDNKIINCSKIDEKLSKIFFSKITAYKKIQENCF